MNASDTVAKNIEIVRRYLALVERLEDAEGVSRCWHCYEPRA
jgi:hypothetical protein